MLQYDIVSKIKLITVKVKQRNVQNKITVLHTNVMLFSL